MPWLYNPQVDPERPVLVDKYLDRADELDVDALCDKDGNVTICGIMQHIEQARSLKSSTLSLTRLRPSDFQGFNPQSPKASTLIRLRARAPPM